MWVVFKKELYRVYSDKKLLFSTFFLPPLINMAIIGVIVAISVFTSAKIDNNIPRVFINNSPEFLQKIDGFDTEYGEALEEHEVAEKVKSGEFDIALSFDKDFDRMVEHWRVPVFKYYGDFSNDYSKAAYSKLEQLYIEPYRQQRLTDLIGDAELLKVFHDVDMSIEYGVTEERVAKSRFIAKIAPYIIFIMILGSAMGLVMESVAGEKERGTLATQLLSPLPREQFALGKLFGLSVHVATGTVVSVLSYFLLLLLAVTFIPKELFNVEIYYTFKELFLMLVVLIASLLMNTSIFMCLSALGRNIKEASNYIMPYYMAAIFMCIIPMQMPSGEPFAWWMYLVPVLGQVCAVTDVLAFSVNVPMLFVAIIVPLSIALGMVFFIRNIFNNERFIVGD